MSLARVQRYSETYHLATALFGAGDMSRCLMLFSGWFDTSGTIHDAGVVVTAGVVSTAQKWIKFERRWAAALAEFDVTQFHMKDFAHFKGEFADWRGDNEKRGRFIERLFKEIKLGTLRPFAAGVFLPDYRTVDCAYSMTETLGGPYTFAQGACQTRAISWLTKKYGGHHPAQFFIEKGDHGQSEFRHLVSGSVWDNAVILPKVNHNTGRAYCQFQAADLIAYELRRIYESLEAKREWPHPATLRQSAQTMRRLLPLSLGIHDEESITNVCRENEVPRRETAQ